MTLSDYHLHWLLFSENWWHMTLEYCRHFNIKLTLGKNCDPLITSNEWMMHLYGHPFFLRDFDYTANWFLMVRLFLGWERRKLYYKTFLSVLKKKAEWFGHSKKCWNTINLTHCVSACPGHCWDHTWSLDLSNKIK